MIYIGNNQISSIKLGANDISAIYCGENKMYPIAPKSDDQIGEIAYWNGGNIAFTPYSAWTSSLGTPLAVCVIPKIHYGKARFMSIKGVTSAGTASDTDINMVWGPYGTDTPLTNYNTVPTWDNTIGGTTGTSSYGYISSDKLGFTGNTNVIDTKTKYRGSTPYIPSPYASDGSLNTDYNVGLLSDLDGKSNTSILAASGTSYPAANACSKYSTDGTSAGDWYLPAMGELAYIMPRWNVINAALTKVGGVLVAARHYYWSSTEYSDNDAYYVYAGNGNVDYNDKDYSGYVRPFVRLS